MSILAQSIGENIMLERISNDTDYSFILRIKANLNTISMYGLFNFGNVRKLEINGKFIYLWQDAKGNVCYCFNLLDKDYLSTSAAKFGNVLSSHFQCEIEVVNNVKESLKKVTSATIGLNKAIADSQRYDDYISYSQQFKSYDSLPSSDISFGQSLLPSVHERYPQEDLHREIINLSVYQHDSSKQTFFISINELPIVHGELFRPYINQAFFLHEGLIYKNSFIVTRYMVEPFFRYNLDGSIIVLFIFFMAKNNIEQAMKIFIWLANTFNFRDKLPFALVLSSRENNIMKLFYEEIINPLLNPHHCEQLTNNTLDEKLLSKNLDEKVVYNFHNVTTPTVLENPSKEFIDRLLHKDELKLGNKIVTTVANVLITSTTKYIPLITKDVPCLFVDIQSSLDKFCKTYNLNSGYHSIAKLIEDDLDNFVGILRYVDMERLNSTSNLSYYNTNGSGILDGDADVLEVFDKSIRSKDEILFEVLKIKDEKLYQKLIEDFDKSRIDRKNLIEYFRALFGTGIYKSNRALIEALKDISNTKEPFGNITTFNNNGRVYYRL